MTRLTEFIKFFFQASNASESVTIWIFEVPFSKETKKMIEMIKIFTKKYETFSGSIRK